MPIIPDVLWLNVSPALKRFNSRLAVKISQKTRIGQWEYSQTLDEPNSFTIALALLDQYLQSCDHPIHLIGHGASGLLGLLYARQHPENVKSLTLLSVGVAPAINWETYYYEQIYHLKCCRSMLMTQIAYDLLDCRSYHHIQAMVKVLEQDLLTSLSLHTLLKQVSIPSGGVTVPLFIGCGGNDPVISPNLFYGWQNWLKEGDRHWLCHQGKHFFHNDHPDLLMEQIEDFWISLSVPTNHTALTMLSHSLSS